MATAAGSGGRRGFGVVADWARKYPLAPRWRREERLWLRTIDGVPISAARLAGPADAPCTIVLVHGFLNSSRSPVVHACRIAARFTFPLVVRGIEPRGTKMMVCGVTPVAFRTTFRIRRAAEEYSGAPDNSTARLNNCDSRSERIVASVVSRKMLTTNITWPCSSNTGSPPR